eukprot:5296574-Pyramimonas_sp.AAC.1
MLVVLLLLSPSGGAVAWRGARLFRGSAIHRRWPDTILLGGSQQLARRRTQPYAVVSTVFVSIAIGGVPYGATKR